MAVTKVEYYDGAVLLGTVSSAPFNEFAYSNLQTGVRKITAKVYNDNGNIDVSTVANIAVKPLSNPLFLDSYAKVNRAYSLRQLRTLYTGNAIQIINSSAQTFEIPFLNGVLDTAYLLSVAPTSAAITKWYDQSGNGHDWITSGTDRPFIVQSGALLTVNGKAAIKSGSIYNIMKSTIDTLKNCSIFTVMTETRATSTSLSGLVGGQGADDYVLSYHKDSTSTALTGTKSGAPSYYVNSIAFTGNRGELFTALQTQKIVSVTDIEVLSWTEFNSRYYSSVTKSPEYLQELILMEGIGDRVTIEANQNAFYTVY